MPTTAELKSFEALDDKIRKTIELVSRLKKENAEMRGREGLQCSLVRRAHASPASSGAPSCVRRHAACSARIGAIAFASRR